MERDFFIVKKCPEFGLKMTVKKGRSCGETPLNYIDGKTLFLELPSSPVHP
jgi:hypothetical protein